MSVGSRNESIRSDEGLTLEMSALSRISLVTVASLPLVINFVDKPNIRLYAGLASLHSVLLCFVLFC